MLNQLAWVDRIRRAIPFKLAVLRRRPSYPDDRLGYQSSQVSFDIGTGDRVLDIGSGGYPFVYANILVDRFLEPSAHRHAPLVQDERALIVADVERLPFADKSVDFVYCSHVLEHVEDPIAAAREIIRVGKRGYVETPTLGKDVLFAWAKGMHRWHAVSIGHSLCFFEYSGRQLEGIRSTAWRDLIQGPWRHPLQEAFYRNEDVFNTMLCWEDSFSVFVFRLSGSIDTLNVQTAPSDSRAASRTGSGASI